MRAEIHLTEYRSPTTEIVPTIDVWQTIDDDAWDEHGELLPNDWYWTYEYSTAPEAMEKIDALVERALASVKASPAEPDYGMQFVTAVLRVLDDARVAHTTTIIG